MARPATRVSAVALASALVIATLGCAKTAPPVQAPSVTRQAVAWTYDVRAAGSASNVLHIDASFAPSASDALGIDPDATPFVHDAQYQEGGEWKPLRREGDGWRAPCHARREGCRIRYSFALGEAALDLDDVETAYASAGVLVAPPSTWLVHPAVAPGDDSQDDRFQARVTTEGGAQFASAMPASTSAHPFAGTASASHLGVAQADGGALATDEHSFEGATRILDRSSFAVFGAFDLAPIRSDGAVVWVAYSRSPGRRGQPPEQQEPGAQREQGNRSAAVARTSPGGSTADPTALTAETASRGEDDRDTLSPDDIVEWVRRAVSALSSYYGFLPVSKTLVAVLPGEDSETRGETISEGGPAVVIRTAKGLTARAARDDWVVTHELVHATLPSFGRVHAWLDEGIATYVEPIVRTRAGTMTVETYWRELVDGLPQGLPEANDRGLERTHTWGRTYWGGALFCFVADVRIRAATHGARSFDDALRALAALPLDDSRMLDVARFLEIGDRATGTSVLTALYAELALAPGTIDLPSLWASLGVRRGAAGVGFDDAAPLAFVRTGITRPGPARTD